MKFSLGRRFPVVVLAFLSAVALMATASEADDVGALGLVVYPIETGDGIKYLAEKHTKKSDFREAKLFSSISAFFSSEFIISGDGNFLICIKPRVLKRGEKDIIVDDFSKIRSEMLKASMSKDSRKHVVKISLVVDQAMWESALINALVDLNRD